MSVAGAWWHHQNQTKHSCVKLVDPPFKIAHSIWECWKMMQRVNGRRSLMRGDSLSVHLCAFSERRASSQCRRIRGCNKNASHISNSVLKSTAAHHFPRWKIVSKHLSAGLPALNVGVVQNLIVLLRSWVNVLKVRCISKDAEGMLHIVSSID